MTNKIHERVLLSNGEFGHFPERYIEASVKREEREPVHIPQDEPLIPHGEKGKMEVKAKADKQSKAQKLPKIHKPEITSGDESIKDPLIPHGVKGKAELAGKLKK